MKTKAFATSALVASLSFAPVSPFVAPAHADGKDVIAGLIVGGIIGAAINEESKKKKKSSGKAKSKSSKSKSSGISAEQKAANIEVQQALNYFGWPVGTADGAIGPKSRAAISDYQAFLGYPATGQLTEEERTVLVTSHVRAEAGGSAIAEIVSGSPYGMKGVLLAQRDEMRASGPVTAAVAPTAPAQGSVVGATVAGAIVSDAPPPAPVPAPVAAPAPITVATEPAPAPAPVVDPEPEVAAAEPGLPSFMDPNGGKGALSSNCNAVTLAAGTNGGYATAETMTDANAALSEQLCLTRAAAIATGDALAAKVAGFTPDQIAAQCAGFGPVLKDQVAALSMRPADEVLAGVEAFILQSGMSPAQLSGTAKVCLSVGYKADQMDIAIGSALMLTAMGETGYAELLGHHLAQGYGATQRPDLAIGWYEMALKTLDGGTDVFAPGMSGRDDLIRKASFSIAGRAWELAPQPKIEEAALPSFAVTPEAPETAVAAVPEETAPVAPAAVAAVAVPEADPAPAAPVEPVAQAVVEAPPVEPAPLPEAVEPAPALAATQPMSNPNPELMQIGSDVAMGLARAPLMIFAVGF
ncbi:peptidoglycan-binding protein [Rhodobacter sp. Har01]|uniref:peptidoglycan-binding domain-containing protein n=1 Tax=Rhodobacter sp. Har01 TaxID=2883999 RepID=UPI001D078F5B|nr:peptidoglycan-binding domain-containing protein [Rhodobacter sp. Har01]MCB6178691.1 peptidoglycan-binding protein [Rhodobacter sp. Har01]